MSNLLTFPSLHICPTCNAKLATDGDGKPCTDCQWEREQFVRAAKRLGIMADQAVEERRKEKILFQAWTVMMFSIVLAGLSFVVWMAAQ